MQLGDWIISISGAFIAIMMGITSYFANNWIIRVEEAIKEFTRDLKNLTEQISTLKSEQSSQAENIAKTVLAKFPASQLSNAKVDKFEEEVGSVKDLIQRKILPQTQDNFGRIVVLERDLRQHNEKLTTMFNVLQVLNRRQKSRK